LVVATGAGLKIASTIFVTALERWTAIAITALERRTAIAIAAFERWTALAVKRWTLATTVVAALKRAATFAV
jgi:hypothetical protein